MVFRPIFLAAVAAIVAGPAQAECNRQAAMEVQSMLGEFSKSHVEGDHLAVYWTYKIEKDSEPKRLKMVKTYTDMDACLAGQAREIMFYRKDKLMGIASPTSGIRLIK